MNQRNTAEQQEFDWLLNSSDQGREMTLMDFVKVVPYQKKWFFGIACTILVLGVLIINMLPRLYVSEASIMMERQGIYSSSQAGSQEDKLTLRMHSIIKALLKSENVVAVMNKFNMIDDGVQPYELPGWVDHFRNSAKFEFDNVDVVTGGRAGSYSMGITVSYESESAELSYQIAKELTDRLLRYNAGKIAEQSDSQKGYLNTGIGRARAELTAAETRLSEFKRDNAMYLPEMKTIVINRIADMQRRLVTTEDRITLLRGRIDDYSAQMATTKKEAALYTTEGQRLLAPKDRLRVLEVEYASIKNKYSVKHPERVRMEEEIEALRAHVGKGVSTATESELNYAKQELAKTLERYSDKHPNLDAMREQVAFLENKLAQEKRGGSRVTEDPTNPAYTRLKTLRTNIMGEIGFQEKAKRNILFDIEQAEDQLAKMPAIEQQYIGLTRALEREEKKYDALEEEMLQMDLDSGMRDADLYEKFVLLEPPVLPQFPSKPNKTMLYMVLLVISLAIAYAVVFLMHFIRDKILGSEDVEQITDLPIFLIPDFDRKESPFSFGS